MRPIALAIIALLMIPTGGQSQVASMLGKTCRGTFQVGTSTSDFGLGGFHFTFAGTAESPTGHFYSTFGVDAFRRMQEQVKAGRLSDEQMSMTDRGEMKSLKIEANRITFNSIDGAKIDLAVAGNKLTGTADPRGIPGRATWTPADVLMICQ